MTTPRILLATVSGSFHRHLEAVVRAVHELGALGVHVVSPADPTIVARDGDFLFVASDRVRSVRLVEDRHLEALRASDFLWLVDPDGYVGQSASMELGYAAATGVPVYSTSLPTDLTLRQYVQIVDSMRSVVQLTLDSTRPQRVPGILVDVQSSVQDAHRVLEELADAYRTPISEPAARAALVYDKLTTLSAMARPPRARR